MKALAVSVVILIFCGFPSLCSTAGVCEYDGHSQEWHLKKMKKDCAKLDNEEECGTELFCQWSCCSAAINTRKALKSCPTKTTQEECRKKPDRESGGRMCEWTVCSDAGVCKYDGHSQEWSTKKMKRDCAKLDNEEECGEEHFCEWLVGADALDVMIENADYFDEEEEEIKENVFAVNFEHGVKETVYKGSLYAMAGVGVVGCAFLAIYKKRKLSKEIATANTSFGENKEYGAIA